MAASLRWYVRLGRDADDETREVDTVTSRVLTAVLAGHMLLLTACGTSASGPESPPRVNESPTPAAVTPTKSTPTSTGPTEQVLLNRVRAEGTLSVIVEVALDGTAAPNSSEKQRLIAEAQDDLIAELDTAHVKVTTRFKYTAQLTLTVDEDGMRELFATPRVTRVWENRSIPLE